MGGGGDRQRQRQLEQQQQQDRALFLQSYSQASQPSELQKRLEAEDIDYLDWEGGKGAYAGQPLDVMKAPGLGTARSLYQHAKEGQTYERQGIGALRMGLNATDPGLAAKLAEQSKARREQDAAGGLEEAVAQKSAEVRGSALPLIGLDQSRRLGLAGLSSNQSQNSTGLWAQFRPQPGFWSRMATGLAQGAGQGASMMFA